MKFYTTSYKIGQPSIKKINVGTNSDYMIGVKVYDQNGNPFSLDTESIALVDKDGDLYPEKIKNGYAAFVMSSSDEENDKYFTVKMRKEGKKTSETVIAIYTKYMAAQKIWVSGSKKNFTTDDLNGMSFDYNSFGELKINLDNVGSNGTKESKSFTIKEYVEGRTSQDKVLSFAVGVKSYAYVFSDPRFYTESGIYEIMSSSEKKKVDNVKIDATLQISYSYFTTTATEPSAEFGDLVPVEKHMSLETPAMIMNNSIFELVVNEQPQLEGDVSGATFDRTIIMSGSFADGTEFSYELPIK